ncbi:unnamed protein product, partial [Pylaiella littoralis]
MHKKPSTQDGQGHEKARKSTHSRMNAAVAAECRADEGDGCLGELQALFSTALTPVGRCRER